MEYFKIGILLYLSQVILYTGLMLLIYMLILRNRPLHKFNRVYLLCTAVLPAIIPFLKLPESVSPKVTTATLSATLPDVVIYSDGVEFSTAINTVMWSLIIYVLVGVVVLITQLYAYFRILRIVYKAKGEKFNGYTLLKHTGYGPGSWGKYILLPEGDVPDAIIKHEKAHVDLHHTRDVIFLSLLRIVLWPNLFLLLIRRELTLLHEFQADEAAGVNNEEYSRLLLSSVFGTCTLPLTHSFIIHPIKRRIMMLNKKNKRKSTRGLVAAIAAAVIFSGIVTIQSCRQEDDLVTTIKSPDVENSIDSDEDEIEWYGPAVFYNDDSLRTVAYKMPEFKGNIYEFMGSYIRYPKALQEAGIEGKVIVKFIVDKNGEVAQKQILSSPHDSLSKAVIDMLYKMPAWEPGEDENGNKLAVWFELPVTFKLENKQSKVGRATLKETLREVGLYVQSSANVILDDNGDMSFMPTDWEIGKDENGKVKGTFKLSPDNLPIGMGSDESSPLNAKSLASKIAFEEHTGALVFKMGKNESANIESKDWGKSIVARMDKNSSADVSEQAEEARKILNEYNKGK